MQKGQTKNTIKPWERQQIIPHDHCRWCSLHRLHVKQRQSLKQTQLELHQQHYPKFHRPNKEEINSISITENKNIRTVMKMKRKKKHKRIPNGATHACRCFQYTFQAFFLQGPSLQVPTINKQPLMEKARNPLTIPKYRRRNSKNKLFITITFTSSQYPI